jgi:hypothetical protein
LDPWVDAATAGAVVCILLRCVGPNNWRHPKQWRIPDIGGTFFVFVGANAITEAFKVARLLVLGRVAIVSHIMTLSHHGGVDKTYSAISTDALVFFLGGVVAGIVVGIISIRDGLGKLTPDET